MRCFLTAPLVIASLAGYVYSHRFLPSSLTDEGTAISATARRRKSLGFGPEHPHAVFRSNPYQIKTNNAFGPFSLLPPIEVARLFVEDLLTGRPEGSSYEIRKDSYTDQNTRVTHVYVRQLINGIEVADGDMNINVKDGIVISYGNSFYNGPVPQPFTNDNINTIRDPREEACSQLFLQLTALQRDNNLMVDSEQVLSGQVPMAAAAATNPIHELEYLLNTNCQILELPAQFTSQDMFDFRPALLYFMATATPNPELEGDILTNFDRHKEAMKITPISHFAPGMPQVEFEVDNVPDAVNPVKARIAYIQVPNQAGDNTELHLVWKFEVEMKDNWYETAVSMSAPHKIISVVDWAADAPLPPPSHPYHLASYNVFKWGINDPTFGNRTLEKENFDPIASPAGWHALPYSLDPTFKNSRNLKKMPFWRNTSTTWGNNVFAQENWEGQNQFVDNFRPDGGKLKVFDYSYDPQETEKPEAMDEAQKYINATIAQLFYTSNLVHDFYYRYGFDELAGNFQQYNFGRGGAEGDAVIANAQDGSGFNNANFMTPPDGQNGRMRMYLWNTALPYRDGDLEAGIVIHELSHGLSTRMTGGPANSGCLGWGESGGMGEGWGDFLATTIRSNRNYSDYPMGAWAANRESGIRNYIYSMDESINPSTYKILDKPGYWGVHAVGEVWAEMLWVVSQKLIEKHGYADDLFPPSTTQDLSSPSSFYRHRLTPQGQSILFPKHGNSLIVQLALNAMKLQPCRPSFFEARDAIIQADQVLTEGENFCTLWEGFAVRGLGEDAKVINRTPWGGGIRTNGFEVPLVCRRDDDGDDDDDDDDDGDDGGAEPNPEEPEEPEWRWSPYY